jgi:hypothetical protein
MYEERVIAFFDILGFKELICKNVKNDAFIRDILNWPKEYIEREQGKKSEQERYKNTNFSFMSDSIIISFKRETTHGVFNLLNDILSIIIGYINKSILCRGSIVTGKMIHENDLLFGPDFCRAVEFEKKAKYPRILVDEDVLQAGEEYPNKNLVAEVEGPFNKAFLRKDNDGLFYIDYFSTLLSPSIDDLKIQQMDYIKTLNTMILAGIKNSDRNIREKYEWMKNKFHKFLDELLSVRRGPFKDNSFQNLTVKEIEEIKNDFYEEIRNI